MAALSWYWYRLRAMSAGEMARHVRKQFRQFADARRERDWGAVKLESSGLFPRLPQPQDAPAGLRQALRRDAANILAGRWKAFGHLDLRVDDPPNWHRDYLVGRDLGTDQSAFQLNHRKLPGGADIKLIWELSRWYALVRLAMAAQVLGDEKAGRKCVVWLEDWVKHNPPFRGWNWTSGLEAGMRLVQFTWIDALLGARADEWGCAGELATLRQQILPPHAWYAWRHQSFGSSANNHLLGELAGLIVATVRWPALARWGAPLGELQRRWEREVLAQFAEDGGNREQALNYQLFSWEFCWQSMEALHAVGRSTTEVESRLFAAMKFFVSTQVAEDPWDYGDSDNAFVTPFCADEARAVWEWHRWAVAPAESPAIDYWWGSSPRRPVVARTVDRWLSFPHSGIVVRRSERRWVLRWDVSPLGYGATAAHGHLDALHLSLWYSGVAIVIDPGTGAYFADKTLRNWLAGRSAHNGPRPVDSDDWPKRLGPFLWSTPHGKPVCDEGPTAFRAEFTFPNGVVQRTIEPVAEADGWEVRDALVAGRIEEFTVRWQFAPETVVEVVGERHFRIWRRRLKIQAKVSSNWAEVSLVTDQNNREKADPGNPLAGVVSPAFRKVGWAPYLKLVARGGDAACAFTTTFLTSPNS